MRFKVPVCIAVLLLSVTTLVFAGEKPGLQKISEHVYAYVDGKSPSPASSFGANAGLVVGKDGALVIDTLVSAKEADRLLADIRKVTDKKVRYVVNTHYHLDHAWGNCVFTKVGATVIAHENALKHRSESAQALAHPENFGLTVKDLEGTTLQGPTITFTNSMSIDLGDVTVVLNYPGPTHTTDSITAYVPQDKVLFVGDILFTGYHPFLGEGDITRWQQVLGKLEQTPATKIVPGHGPVSTKADLGKMETYLKEFDAAARTLCAGKSADDAPALAKELIKRLPEQQRNKLANMVELNLRLKYLPQPKEKK